jgi:hypothetical protein
MARRWSISVGAALALLLTLVGSVASSHPPPATAVSTPDPEVIDFSGLGDIRFGASMSALVASGVVSTSEPACGPTFTGTEAATPVFDHDRLVLIWAHAPIHTPEGIMAGSSVDEARRAYPSAVALTPPAGTYTFPGLLVTSQPDRAYLLLHDQGQVQKLIVGLERYARLLYETGFGSC